MNLISAEIIADSLNQHQERITTFKLVFPRYILAELNTHRVFTKNSSSSRAIPFKKMVQQVLDKPFIPIAFQKDHKGMQGTKYLDSTKLYKRGTFSHILRNIFKYSDDDIASEDYTYLDELVEEVAATGSKKAREEKTLEDWWLYCRDQAVKSAILMSSLGVTKQLCNRILEPFLYHTVLLTATEFENFFKLRCNSYTPAGQDKNNLKSYKSWKDLSKDYPHLESHNIVERLEYGEGQADIHIMDLAEKMWDAYNENKPKQLEVGEWHIPFGNDFDELLLNPVYWVGDNIINRLKIATARCARISYQTLGDNPVIDYEKDIKLHDDLLKSGHWSPFEHCAQVMDKEDYYRHVKGIRYPDGDEDDEDVPYRMEMQGKDNGLGWSNNFKGFKQYREILQANVKGIS